MIGWKYIIARSDWLVDSQIDLPSLFDSTGNSKFESIWQYENGMYSSRLATNNRRLWLSRNSMDINRFDCNEWSVPKPAPDKKKGAVLRGKDESLRFYHSKRSTLGMWLPSNRYWQRCLVEGDYYSCSIVLSVQICQICQIWPIIAINMKSTERSD